MNIFFLLTNITILLMLDMKDYCYDCLQSREGLFSCLNLYDNINDTKCAKIAWINFGVLLLEQEAILLKYCVY